MPSLDQYKRRLQNKNESIKAQRRKAADLNNELAWELADGHQNALILTRNEIDDNYDAWYEMDILVRHALTGQEKKIITKPNVHLPIGSYVRYNDVTCIIRENLLDPQDVMPSYKAYICTTELHLKGCPFSFPVYAFNSSYSSKGLVDYDKVMGLDSRNKLYIQKNKYTVRLYENHRNYRVVVGDEETQYYYFITEMDDISYPGMFVISLKVDEKHVNDEKLYAFNEREIDFSDLDRNNGISLPTIYCDSYCSVGDKLVLKCSNPIESVSINNLCLTIDSVDEHGNYILLAQATGLCQITVTDVSQGVVTKNIMIK